MWVLYDFKRITNGFHINDDIILIFFIYILQPEGRIQLRLFHDEVHNTLEISVANIAFGNEDCTTIDLQDIIITLRT